ncbi:MAG: ATP-dependent helicase HrpB [Proteobacteria bacterium]|nr:ATP-dependent helicase HrpB [Pseudomonadota bacterium]
MTTGLPIDAALPELRARLVSHTRVVLQAPPGAGKSTVVPLALLDEPWLRGKRLIMLEPRRLAARAVAARMAHTLGESIGRTVGYRMRLETRVSAATRIEVVTEGILTRMLQSDPALEGVGAVLFDEFHERSLAADLGLALTLDAQANLSPQLRVLVMSATLDGERVAQWLDNAPLVRADGRTYPVTVSYLGTGMPALPGEQQSPERLVLSAIRRALLETSGDLLVFLPGAGEIRRVQGMLAQEPASESPTATRLRVVPLFGELAADEQDRAFAPAGRNERKVVLATNIAETSVTIDGVSVVIDSGLVRRASFDPASGMSRLDTQRISRASAEQRAGRAGRTAPGQCYRLWGEGAQRSLAAFSTPEIVTADLAPLALELAAWGTREQDLRWLDAPPPAMLASARDLLRSLAALEADGCITGHGRAMSAIGAHPRLAHLLLVARSMRRLPEAAWLAALLSERDILRPTGRESLPGSTTARDSDVRSRLAALRGVGTAGMQIDRATIERVRRNAHAFQRQLDSRGAEQMREPPLQLDEDAGALLALAYPDRIGRRREGEKPRYQLASGRGAAFRDAESIGRREFIVAVDLDDREREALIRLAVPIERATLLEQFAARLQTTVEVQWDVREAAVAAQEVTRLDKLVIASRPLTQSASVDTTAAMLDGVRQLGLERLPWNTDSRNLQARIAFVRGLDNAPADWPDVSDAALSADLGWLVPWLEGVTRRAHLERIRLNDVLRAQLSYDQQQTLSRLAPETVELPTGTQARIDYRDDNAPAASMRMQEVFGLAETPRIGGGRVALTFKLLSPAQRPLQITRDLASFWRNAYAEVRKDMRGRYPRHYWPEDPLQAEPTRRAKPRP